eukprot:6466941-Amphidinium_carterae.1
MDCLQRPLGLAKTTRASKPWATMAVDMRANLGRTSYGVRDRLASSPHPCTDKALFWNGSLQFLAGPTFVPGVCHFGHRQ